MFFISLISFFAAAEESLPGFKEDETLVGTHERIQRKHEERDEYDRFDTSDSFSFQVERGKVGAPKGVTFDQIGLPHAEKDLAVAAHSQWNDQEMQLGAQGVRQTQQFLKKNTFAKEIHLVAQKREEARSTAVSEDVIRPSGLSKAIVSKLKRKADNAVTAVALSGINDKQTLLASDYFLASPTGYKTDDSD